MIQWQIEKRNINDLIGYDKNPRKFTDKGLKDLKKSLQNCGDANIITINADDTVLGGHARLTVMKQLGYTEVDVKVPTKQLTEKQVQEVVVRLNANTAGEWDLDKLQADFELDELQEWGLDIEFDTEEELQEVIEDEVPEEVETRAKLGDIWQLGEHRLMCGDSTSVTDVEKLMNGEKADLLFTDPPYGVSYEKKTKEVLKTKNYTKIKNDDLTLSQFQEFLFDVFSNARLQLKDTASYYVFSCQGGDQEMMMMMMRECGIPCRHQIIWVKDAPVFSMGRLDYDYKHEPILYGWVKKHDFKRKGSQDKSVWEFKRTENKLHPTMKPVDLIVNALLNSTDKQENVLDLFGGSGSTLIACEQLNRKCFMMELDPHYVDVIITRWENLTGKKAVLCS